MIHSVYFNTVLGTGLALILVFFDYIRKFNTDQFLRRFFLIAITAAFLAFILNYFCIALSSGFAGNITIAVISALMIMRAVCFYAAFVFMDYFVFGEIKKTNKIILAVLVILALYIISVILNPVFNYYFYIGADNQPVPGKYYMLNLIVIHIPVLFCIINSILAIKQLKQVNLLHMLNFCFLSGFGSLLDLFFKTTGLEWLCFSAAALFTYFFIIRQDLKTDALTGIGNRYSFNEFIEKLSRRGITRKMFKKSWAVVMIDMDHFKEINDTLGHMEGDNALRDMAGIIKGCIRRSDFAARYGGDEFVLAARAETDIEKLIARLRKDIDHHNETAGRPYKLEISFGYDIFTTDGKQTIDEFLAHIDTLMYDHKAQNRRISDRTEAKAR